MMPLALTAAFGAVFVVTKFNELRFSTLNQDWQHQRLLDKINLCFNLIWFYEQISTHQPALEGRLRKLQAQKADIVQKCLDLHKEMPFAHFPTRMIANVKRSRALRSHFRDVNRDIDAACCCTGPRLITGGSHRTGSVNPIFQCVSDGNATFLAQLLISWWLPRGSDFHSQTFQACIGQFRTRQLDQLNGQMNFLHSKAIERIWGQMIGGSEKIVVAISLLQFGFISSIPLSIGSSILAHYYSKQLRGQIPNKFFKVFSCFFGIGALAFVLAMVFTVHRYSELLQRGKERIKAIDNVEELMRITIKLVCEKRFGDTLKLMLRAHEERGDKIFESYSRHFARTDERLAWADRTIAELKAQSAERQMRIENQAKEIAALAKLIKDSDEQDRKLALQDEMLRALLERCSALENSQLARAV